VTVSSFSITKVQLLGSTPGLIAKGDQVIITFSGPINVTNFCSSWTGTGNQTLGGTYTVATITDGVTPTDDTLTVSRSGAPSGCTTLNFGSIDLGSSAYVSGGNVTFSGPNAGNPTTIMWTAATDTLTITLGKQNTGPSSPGTPAQVLSSPSDPIYTTPITDQLGDPVSNSPFTIQPGPYF
jgi:hypothetical protein